MTMCVSALALTSLDAVARIGRMSFQELFSVDDMEHAEGWRKSMSRLIEEFTVSNDGGDSLPNFFIACGSKLIEIVGMQSTAQIYALCEIEFCDLRPEETLVAVITLATENQRG